MYLHTLVASVLKGCPGPHDGPAETGGCCGGHGHHDGEPETGRFGARHRVLLRTPIGPVTREPAATLIY